MFVCLRMSVSLQPSRQSDCHWEVTGRSQGWLWHFSDVRDRSRSYARQLQILTMSQEREKPPFRSSKKKQTVAICCIILYTDNPKESTESFYWQSLSIQDQCPKSLRVEVINYPRQSSFNNECLSLIRQDACMLGFWWRASPGWKTTHSSGIFTKHKKDESNS